MQRWLTRMYERDRARYLDCVIAFVVLGVMVLVAPAATFIPARYEGLSTGRYLVVVGAAEALATIALAVTAVVVGPEIRALYRWTKTGAARYRAPARTAAFIAPRRVGAATFAAAAPFTPALVALLALPNHHTAALDWVELSIGAPGATLAAALSSWFALDVLLRPIRVSLGGAPPGIARASLVARLALVIPGATWISASAVGFLTTTRAHAGAGHLLVVYAIAVGCTALCLVVFSPLFIGAVVAPVRELMRATRTVAAGRFDARLPVDAADELGALAESFNEMLDELEASRGRIVTAADTARRQVERDLHDGAQQRLVLLKLKLGMLARDPSRIELIAQLDAELDQAMAELRDLARGIYPPRLESDGLRGALADVVETTPLATTLECDGIARYAPEVEAAVYFCCLEALQNAVKHAGGEAKLTVELGERDGRLVFGISDDGQGFDRGAAGAGMGIQNMSDRIGALGGTVTVTSAPAEGTSVTGSVPIGAAVTPPPDAR